jgi:hypothetical protein
LQVAGPWREPRLGTRPGAAAGLNLAIRYPPLDRELRGAGALGLGTRRSLVPGGITWLIPRPGPSRGGRSREPGTSGCPAGGVRARVLASPPNGHLLSWPRSGLAGRRSSRRAARLEVRLAASPGALAALVRLGAAAAPALEAAEPPGQDGWRVLTPSPSTNGPCTAGRIR